ncbi:MAG: Copper-transporting P-type ATPase, partial [Chlamydiae bacterium]|nr:Copper-transporting P-type ATPase [Chlamydiota bacterium]
MGIMETKLKIEGMHCVSCESLIANALKQVPGVTDATVSFVSSEATVASKEGQAHPEKYIAAVQSTGYNAYLLAEAETAKTEERYFKRQA